MQMLVNILQSNNNNNNYVNTAVKCHHNDILLTFCGFLYFKTILNNSYKIFSIAHKRILNNILYDNKVNINNEVNNYHNLLIINKSACIFFTMQADDCTFDTFLTFVNISLIPAVWGAPAGCYYILFLFLKIILLYARHDSIKDYKFIGKVKSKNIQFHSILINCISIGGLLYATKQLYIKSINKYIFERINDY